VAGSTKRNKALHLVNLLVWLDSESAVAALASKEVTCCLKILCAFSKLGKQQYNWSMTKAMNNDQLVAAGAALHNKEWPVFILWLLNQIKHCSEPFRQQQQQQEEEASTSTAPASQGTTQQLV
jgi:hypothetical protein